jgi:hypothetical protein
MPLTDKTIKEIKTILFDSFESTYNKKIADSNEKSKELLYNFLNNIYKNIYKKDASISIHCTYKNEKKEWLYDGCITKSMPIKESDKKKEFKINTSILLAIECEFSTSLTDFYKDLGKLICSKSDNIIFIAGVNQKYEQEKYIKKRIDSINKYLKDSISNLILIFFPSTNKHPKYSKCDNCDKYGKQDKCNSFWDCYNYAELCKMIKIYTYSEKNKMLEEIQN